MTRAEPFGPHPWWRWFAVLGGPAAYAGHLLVSYFGLPLVCAMGTRLPLYAVTIAAAGIAATATTVGWRQRRRPAARADDPRIELQQVMSLIGAYLSALATATILLAGAATLLFDPCENWV